jgi:hypothetical protein
MASAAQPGTNPTRREQEHVDELINKMVKLKILDENDNFDDGIQFTQEFNLHLGKIEKRVDGDPESHTDSSDISEKLKSILMNYLEDKTKTKIAEDELYDMGVMVYSLIMRNAGKDPVNPDRGRTRID